MSNELHDYGFWWLVAFNSALFIVFAFSFFRPSSPRDWRSFGAFSAFLVALFTEMYGFPLTIYLLSGWLTSAFPDVDWFAHDSGHLLEIIFGWGGNPHIGPFHLLSSVFVFGGFVLLVAAWRVLYRAQRTQTVARTGPYAVVRHPQYAAFISIMFGFLLQWPTLPTLVMFPILVFMYTRLARREEREALAGLGDEYRGYRQRTPAFLPKLRHAASLAAVVLFLLGLPVAGGYLFAQQGDPDPDAPVARSVSGNFAAGLPAGDLMERAQVQLDALNSQMRKLDGTLDLALRRELTLSHLAALGQMAEILGAIDSSLVESIEDGMTAGGSTRRQRLRLGAQVMDMQLDMLKRRPGGAGESDADAAARVIFIR
jgi:protein-S-isoprenylcysteine O-methyltransferase Ste14